MAGPWDEPVRGRAANMGRVGDGWGWLMLYGLASVAIGLFALVQPVAATFAATLVVGASLAVAGLASLGVAAFGHGVDSRAYAAGFGALSLLVGGLMLASPASGALSLTLLVATWLAVRGVLEIVVSRRLRRGRGLMVGLGVLNLLLAAFVLATLGLSALAVPGYVLAASFLAGGANAVASAAHHRRDARAFAA